MKELIENLYPINRCLLGEGYDNALEYIKHLIDLEIIEIKSGTKLGTWTVPDEWIVKDAWIKNSKGEKIADYKTSPLSLVVGSDKTHGFCDLAELKRHILYLEDQPNATAYMMNFYGSDWGFCLPYSSMRERIESNDPNIPATFKDKLPEDNYEVEVDTEHVPGKMKLGVHTIKGQSDKEILLFAHLDHPFQANDNLSGVACLVDMAKRINAKHTIKIIFCPETIGSIAYALTQDLSKVDFMIAVDICGNKNSILLQKSFDAEHKLNRIAHLAIHSFAETYRKGTFRNTIGSDEYVFNDPLVGVPGLMFSTWPYKEYHTADDTPEKIDYEMIQKVQDVIIKTIEIYEKDFIPKREFKGPLMRSRYGIQTNNPQFNLSWDYFIYNIDGKRSLAELCAEYGLNFDQALEVVLNMEKDGFISRVDSSEGKIEKTTTKKHKKLSGRSNVRNKSKEMPTDIS